jgi:excisionase family DNA binding protein
MSKRSQSDKSKGNVTEAMHTKLPLPVIQSWLGTKEAAEYLGLKVEHLQCLKMANLIPFYQSKPHSKILFLKKDLDKWLKDHNPRYLKKGCK